MNHRQQGRWLPCGLAALALACAAAIPFATPPADASQAAPSAARKSPDPSWTLARSTHRLPPRLALDLQVATLDGAQCWADGACRVAGCTTPDPDCTPTGPPVTASVVVSRHTSVTLSTTTADAILAEATDILQTDNGGGDDIACSFSFARSGAITTFSTSGGSVDNESEFWAVINLPGRIKVLNDINWCGGYGGDILGCSPIPGGSQLVVVQGLTHLDGIVWAHEYGHSRGLDHRSDYNERFVMNEWVVGKSTRINQDECQAFR